MDTVHYFATKIKITNTALIYVYSQHSTHFEFPTTKNELQPVVHRKTTVSNQYRSVYCFHFVRGNTFEVRSTRSKGKLVRVFTVKMLHTADGIHSTRCKYIYSWVKNIQLIHIASIGSGNEKGAVRHFVLTFRHRVSVPHLP